MSAVGHTPACSVLLYSANIGINLFADTLYSSTAPHAADKATAAADVGLPGQCCPGFQHCCTGGFTAAVHEDSRGHAIQRSTLHYHR